MKKEACSLCLAGMGLLSVHPNATSCLRRSDTCCTRRHIGTC